jgi:hypothetical protein
MVMAEQTEAPAGSVAWMTKSDDDVPKVRFDHWFFHKMEEIHFQLSGPDKEPTLVAKYSKNDVVLTIKGIMKEFNIDPKSPDGWMLDQVGKGLKYVKGLCMGDPLPKEILTREASWALSKRHQEIAYQRVSLQLVNWMSGGENMITDPDELLQLADDPAIKKQISAAFGQAAEKLGYGRDEKEKVIRHVEELAKELAYIEALRDRFRRIKIMDDKIQELRRLYGREKSVLEIADQVARLGQRAVSEFEAMFLEADAQTGEILSVLKNLTATVSYIRDKRDELHIRLMAWDDILDRWQQAEMKISQHNPTLLRDTYKFLAPRFMMVKEWVLMSKLQEGGSLKAFSQVGAGNTGGKKHGGQMRW